MYLNGFNGWTGNMTASLRNFCKTLRYSKLSSIRPYLFILQRCCCYLLWCMLP